MNHVNKSAVHISLGHLEISHPPVHSGGCRGSQRAMQTRESVSLPQSPLRVSYLQGDTALELKC